jgi:hypothetical protein
VETELEPGLYRSRQNLSTLFKFSRFISQLSEKLQDLRGKCTGHKMCVSLFCTALCETLLSPANVRRDTGGETYKSAGNVAMKTEISRQLFVYFYSIKFHGGTR